MRFSGTLEEEEGASRRFGSGPGRPLRGLVEQIRLAGKDPSVLALAVRIGEVQGGWAALDELRMAVLDLRSRGRHTFAYLENPSHAGYFLATAFEHLTAPPMAGLDLVGLRAEVTFYKGALDRLGIRAQFEAEGEYKSFGEPFVREEMSEAFRESLDGVLSDIHGRFRAAVAESRGLSETRVQELLDQGPWLAREARDAGLIDRTLYPDRWERAIRRELGESGAAELEDDAIVEVDRSGPFPRRGTLRFRKAAGALRPWAVLRSLESWSDPAPRIAVVVASGSIQADGARETVAGRIAWRALSRTLRQLATDARVQAVVLRVDSPGGSAAASDLLWRELRRIGKKKPLVVSMGSLAASGGYYLAMAADAVFASPVTITGSIGVVAGKFDLEGLLERVGLRREVLSYGEHTGLFSLSRGLSDSERARLRSHLHTIYEEFVGKAAECRRVERDELERHARGRIWTGSQAVERGLVDRLGTLDDAVAEAARRAGLGGHWRVRHHTAPRPGFLRRVRSRLPGLALAEELSAGPASEPVQARLPFDLRIG